MSSHLTNPNEDRTDEYASNNVTSEKWETLSDTRQKVIPKNNATLDFDAKIWPKRCASHVDDYGSQRGERNGRRG